MSEQIDTSGKHNNFGVCGSMLNTTAAHSVPSVLLWPDPIWPVAQRPVYQISVRALQPLLESVSTKHSHLPLFFFTSLYFRRSVLPRSLFSLSLSPISLFICFSLLSFSCLPFSLSPSTFHSFSLLGKHLYQTLASSTVSDEVSQAQRTVNSTMML